MIESSLPDQIALSVGYMALWALAATLLLAAIELMTRSFVAIRRRFRPQPTSGALGEQEPRKQMSAIWEEPDSHPEPADATRLQSMAWAAGEVPMAPPKPVEGA